MELILKPLIYCVGCCRLLDADRVDDGDERGAKYDAKCADCRVLYRLLVAPYKHSTQ